MGRIAIASCCGLMVVVLMVVGVHGSEYEYDDDLSFSYYHDSCPDLDKIVHDKLHLWFKNDSTLAPSLINLHFHDCAVRVRRSSTLHFHTHTKTIYLTR